MPSTETGHKAALSVMETCAALSISRTHLYAMFKRGELTPIKLGARTVIAASDLHALLERGLARRMLGAGGAA